MSATSKTPSKRRGRPPKITREKLVETAIEIGFAKLTLAEIARRLGITVQSIYNYVTSREELLQIMAEVLAQRFPIPEDGNEDWSEWIYKVAYELKRTYEHAPGIAMIVMASSPVNAPYLPERWERALRIGSRSGFEVEKAIWATLAVREFTYSWVTREELRRAQRNERGVERKGRKASGSGELSVVHRAFARAESNANGERFDVTLRALIAGLSQLRTPSPGRNEAIASSRPSRRKPSPSKKSS